MNNYPPYTVSMEEIHHTQKLDAPSGTAISLANDIIKNHRAYNQWHLSAEEPSGKGSIPITAIREDQVTGAHELTYDSEFDSITLKHEAKNRGGFALGALMAAEFITDKKGLYSMQDVLGL